MIAEKNKVVSIVYELRNGSREGEVVEQLKPETPLTFLFGTGGLLPRFEEHLNGLSCGDHFDFLLSSADAYGPVVESAIVDVPKSVFEIDGKVDENLLQVGNSIPMMDTEGRRLNGRVLKIKDEAVKMDFNHPMAGNDLHFKGEVVDIREATEQELSHGHVHHAGGCGCGNGHGCEGGGCEEKGSCHDSDSGCGCAS